MVVGLHSQRRRDLLPMKNPRAALTVTLVALFGLTGCAHDQQGVQAQPLSDFRGASWSDLANAVDESTSFTVLDISPEVGLEPEYNDSQLGSDDWTVAALCGSAESAQASKTLEVALLPAASVTESVRATITRDGYARNLRCEGSAFRG
jgi:hypothetical protein